MKLFILPLVFFINFGFSANNGNEENVRYILIEAQCESSFNALHDYKEKVILTKVFKKEFENSFDLVNAEPKLIVDFEVALDKAYPNQRNKVRDILVYMLNTEKEAEELYKRKIKLFKTLETGVIELKVK